MADMMTFPDTVEEFMEEYKLVDTEQVYTNGTELVPIFRMKQWFEHEKEQLSCEGTTKGTTSDLISRQTAIDRFNVIRPVDPKKDEYTKGIDVGIAMCIVAVKDQPTIQPEPHEGHWIPVTNGRGGHECDRCHEYAPSYQSGDEYLSKYCPNCGAHMKGAEHETD